MAANDCRCYDVTVCPLPLCRWTERRCVDLSDGGRLRVVPRPRWSWTSTHVPALVSASKTPLLSLTGGAHYPAVMSQKAFPSLPTLCKQVGGPAQLQLLAGRWEEHTGGCLTGCVLDLNTAFMGCFIMPGCTAGVLGGK